MEHSYDSKFMKYTDQSSRYSANKIVTLLRNVIPINSVLDVGCARGTWLATWKMCGVEDIFGVDGDYIAKSDLLVPQERFMANDLSNSFDLGRSFDLVQSLEVAEHLQPEFADQFVQNLVHHSKGIVLFSAAPPGQGGEFHVNEQPYEYWRAKFKAHAFEPYDFIRPLIANDKKVSFWYRFNTVLYVRPDAASALHQSLRASSIPGPIADVSPNWFRARKLVVRSLPYTVQQNLARFKARVFQGGG